MGNFLKRCKPGTTGTICVCRGRTIVEHAAARGRKETATLVCEWLKYFQRQAAFIKQR
jgi:hypothetical protein